MDKKPQILPKDVMPPCKAACPVRTDAQRYVALIAQERFQEALEVIMENNPLPASIGRICVHPCEESCRRGKVDEPIAICALKRFVTDQVGDSLEPRLVPKTSEKKVIIIGSGPSGLAAAHDIARQGYPVKILEKQPEAGGMLRHGILSYRLPKDVLDKDIRNLLAVGIELQTGVAVGSDVNFLDLHESNDAVLIAVGLSASRGIPMQGSDLTGVHYAVPFLESVNYGRPEHLGDDVIVIGGGNVAVDVARSARRLGSKQVKMVCLEAREEMPAHDWEIEEAMTEGIEIHCSFGPNQILGENGRVGGLEFKEVDCVFDEDGRFNPKFHEDRRTVLSGDTVIFAIGQSSELSFLNDTGVALNERGQLVFDRRTMATSLPGVFASGEVATGPGAAISAIANGHRAARAILTYLETGLIQPVTEDEPATVGDVPESIRALIMPSRRQKMPAIDAEKRLDNFSEVDLGFSADAAIREAQRCLYCTAGATVIADKCVACLTCVRVCPYEVPVIEGAVAYMDPTTCQSCGFCAAECPARAIDVRLSGESIFDATLERALTEMAGAKADKIVGIVCQYGHIWGQDRVADFASSLPNVRLIRTLCPGRLSANDLIKAFELGADKVFMTLCGDGYCHFRTGIDLASQKIDYVKSVLDATGIGGDNLRSFEISGGTSIANIIEEMSAEGSNKEV